MADDQRERGIALTGQGALMDSGDGKAPDNCCRWSRDSNCALYVGSLADLYGDDRANYSRMAVDNEDEDDQLDELCVVISSQFPGDLRSFPDSR